VPAIIRLGKGVVGQNNRSRVGTGGVNCPGIVDQDISVGFFHGNLLTKTLTPRFRWRARLPGVAKRWSGQRL
jgi:CobQ-like glutamine amidotransferase family enzyme